jgi:predicted permease
MAPADFRDYRTELRTFEAIAAYLRADLQLGDAAQPEQLRGMQVSAGFFTLLGAEPAIGREFDLNDEIGGNDDVVMLSHALWLRRFNGDPAIVGRAARFSGRMFRVIGVVPDGFKHVGSAYRSYGHGEPVDVWTVLPVPRNDGPRVRFSHYFNVVGRVRRQATRAEVDEDLRRTGASVARHYPTPNSPWKPLLVPLRAEIVGTAESTLLVLSGASALVLLLACVNVASLLVARAAARSREVAVRAAVGATRGRIVRQLLVESLVLAIAGGALGVGLAYGAIAALARFGPADLPRLDAIAIDAAVLVYALGATVGSALLFGVAPALRLARTASSTSLHDGGRAVAGPSSQRMSRVLVSVETALAFVLVVSSALLLRSFVSMVTRTRGFEPRGVITASVELPAARYDIKAAADFHRRAAERVRALPGVRDAAFSSDLPWTGYDENTAFSIAGRTSTSEEGPQARYHFITDGYTRAVGTPLVAGRDLTGSDGENAPPVLLVNESAARKYWDAPRNAVGARVNLWGVNRTIVGVMADVSDMPWHESAVPAVYFPQPQTWYPQVMFLVVRGDVDPGSIVDSIRRALREIDPQLPLANVRPLGDVAGAALATRRLTLWLVGAFGLTALLLAVVGVYGVTAETVGQRRHEFGVRQALGATGGDIMRLVFSSGAAVTIGGLAGGIALAIASTRMLVSLLYGVAPLDPVTFVGVAGVLAAAAGAAAYVPARRAMRINPAIALRSGD